MSHRAEIISDLINCAAKYEVGMPLRERRHISIRVKRLYAGLDALTDDEQGDGVCAQKTRLNT